MIKKAIVQYKNKSLKTVLPLPQQFDDQRKTQQLFFHVGYHPDNLKFFEYQKKFKENIIKPKYRHHLSNLKKKIGDETKIDRMFVAYYLPPTKYRQSPFIQNLKYHILPPT